jgi:hypothetical protein
MRIYRRYLPRRAEAAENAQMNFGLRMTKFLNPLV